VVPYWSGALPIVSGTKLTTLMLTSADDISDRADVVEVAAPHVELGRSSPASALLLRSPGANQRHLRAGVGRRRRQGHLEQAGFPAGDRHQAHVVDLAFVIQVDELTARGTQPVVPPPRSRNPHIDRLAPKDTDSPAQAQWRDFMRSDFAKALYIQRGATVECANAQLRRRGLHRFNVCGIAKARAVLLWHALAHNLMRMRSMNIAFTA
jgi:hypothetical protein